ncbi:hypothetical protein M2137_001067 [Parabacteroides sp. PFB2-10]|uniref:hypothetical protein n=1 Tax=Parabacteroides sp. PFB2-10 TaxID=1742405 RepID=UPI0024751109|nr:hypothetical protein [Parabacteroides sp. PFB2-10]MDH6312297.1 hypothetical protein [Parabacteroides sp. PFB2-10]
MKTEDIYRFMQDASPLSETTLAEWKAIIEDFPWFQTARALYLKNLAMTEDIRFGQELQRMSVYLPDRKKLFLYIEGERYGLLPQAAYQPEDKGDDFSLIDSFLSSFEQQSDRQKSTLLFQPSVSSDYVFWAMTEEGMLKEVSGAKPLQHQELIDSFIREEETRETNRRFLPEEPDKEEADQPVDPAENGEGDEVLDDSYFTETLARIYVKQKRYEKALQIIKTLRLNYPEKSIYFADQIRFLEKLIINTKKDN